MGTGEAWLQHVASSTWLALGPRRLVVPRREADERWLIGDVETTDDALMAAMPPAGSGIAKRFDLIHQDWRVATFRLFRRLVYFPVFSAPEMFDCLELAVRSLLRFGRWRYEVLVLTAADTVGLVRERLEPLGLNERLHAATVAPTTDMVDWCLARYRLDALQYVTQLNPLLYLDTDMVCDRSLEPYLATLDTSDRIMPAVRG